MRNVKSRRLPAPLRSALCLTASVLTLAAGDTAGSAAWRLHASRAAQALAQAGQTTSELSGGSAEVPELRFSDFFSQAAGDRGLELSARLRALDGQRIRIAGFMTREQQRSEGVFLLTPWPTQVSNDGFCLIDDPPPLDIMKLKRKSLSLHWELMFTRPLYGTIDIEVQHRLLNEVSAMVEDCRIRTTMAAHYGKISAANLLRAHTLIESGAARGKIVLEGF